ALLEGQGACAVEDFRFQSRRLSCLGSSQHSTEPLASFVDTAPIHPEPPGERGQFHCSLQVFVLEEPLQGTLQLIVLLIETVKPGLGLRAFEVRLRLLQYLQITMRINLPHSHHLTFLT